MKAAVLWELGKPLSIEEVELDPPKAGEVRIKVGAAGICRSDLHYMKNEGVIATPAVLGHEGAGTVIELGEGVTTLNVGDRVILAFVPNCGRCKHCLTGRANLCDAHFTTGANMFDGTTRLHQGDTRIHHMGKVACFAQEAVVPRAAASRSLTTSPSRRPPSSAAAPPPVWAAPFMAPRSPRAAAWPSSAAAASG